MNLAEHAADALRSMAPPRTIEDIFCDAALRTLATGRPSDPSIGELRALTRPDSVWEGLPPLSDHYTERVARLGDATLLAIALGADAWLADLSACWGVVGDVAAIRATGQIDIFLGGAGWDADTVEILVEESMLFPERPADAAWLALASGDLDGARVWCERLTAWSDVVRREWECDPEAAIRGMWYWPGMALRLPERALQATLDRRSPRRPAAS